MSGLIGKIHYWLFGDGEVKPHAEVMAQKMDHAIHGLEHQVVILRTLTSRMRRTEEKDDVDRLAHHS